MTTKIVAGSVAAKSKILHVADSRMQISMPGLKGHKTLHLERDRKGVWKDKQGYIWPVSATAEIGDMLLDLESATPAE